MAAQSAKEKPHRKSHGAGIFASGKATDDEWGKKFIVVWTGGSAKRIRKTAENGSANRERKTAENGNANRIRKSRIGKTAESGGTSSTRKGATLRSRKWQHKKRRHTAFAKMVTQAA